MPKNTPKKKPKTNSKAISASTRTRLVAKKSSTTARQDEVAVLKRENSRLKRSLRTQKLKNERLLQAASKLNSSLLMTDVLTQISSGINEVMGASCDIYLLEPDGRTLTPVVTLDPDYQDEILSNPLLVDSSLTGHAVKQKKTLLFNDAISAPDRFQIPGTPQENNERVIVAPLIVDKHVMGAMCVTRVGTIFHAEDVSLVDGYATLAASALKNAQVFHTMEHEVEERKWAEARSRLDEERLQALQDLKSVSDQPEQALVAFTMEKGIVLTRSTLGYVAFVDDAQDTLTMYAWSRLAMEECRIDDKPKVYPLETTGLWGEALRQRRPIITNDYLAANPLKKGYPVGHVDLTRHMNIPLMENGKVVAVAGVANKETWYDESDVRQLTLLMDGMWKIISERRAEEALRESEKRYHDLADFLPQIVFEMDRQGNVTYYNKHALLLTGYTEEDINKGFNVFDAVIPEDRLRVQQNLGHLLDGEQYPAEEFTVIKKDGSTFPGLIIAAVNRQGEQVLGFRGFIIDITERKQIEQTLKQSAESYQGLFNSVLEAIYIQDAEGRFLDVNEGAEKMYGYTRAELIGKTPDFVSAPGKNNLELIRDLVAKAFAGDPQQFEFWGRRRTGEDFPKDVHLYPGDYFGQKVVIAVATDITERKRAELALRDSELRYRQLVELSPDAISVIAEERVVYINQAGARMAGIKSTDQIIGRRLSELTLSEVVDGFYPLLRDISLGKLAIPTMERDFIRLDGEHILLELSFMPISHEGQPALQVVARDVTQRKEEQLRLEYAAVDLEKAYDATLEGWSHALEMRERETAGHSQRVVELVLRLSSLMGIATEDQVHIRRGALLHDIGKMGIPDSILLKPASLTKAEWVVMREHPIFAQKFLSNISYLKPALEIPYCHHEHWDGSGYPRGLQGEEIPLAARIFAVVDTWDALTSDRPYRPAWSPESALTYIREQAGKLFDPQVVEIFLKEVSRPERPIKPGVNGIITNEDG